MHIRTWKTSPSFPLAGDSLFSGCWEYELNTGEVTMPHSHEGGQEINLILEGKGLVTVGEVTREVSQGEVVVIPHKTQHKIENPFAPLLRGLTVEASLPIAPVADESGERVTLRDLEEVIDAIPQELEAPEALQIIIRLFDLAGFLSEQIENALGLDTETGLSALTTIEQKVMGAVVQISNNYDGNLPSFYRKRF